MESFLKFKSPIIESIDSKSTSYSFFYAIFGANESREVLREEIEVDLSHNIDTNVKDERIIEVIFQIAKDYLLSRLKNGKRLRRETIFFDIDELEYENISKIEYDKDLRYKLS